MQLEGKVPKREPWGTPKIAFLNSFKDTHREITPWKKKQK